MWGQRVLQRPRVVLAAAAIVVIVAAVLASSLTPSASTDLLVSQRSDVGRANAALKHDFGADPIYAVVSGPLDQTLEAPNLVALATLEGTISRLEGVKAVYGPGTFINQTVVQTQRVVQRELGTVAGRADAAAARVRDQARREGATSAEAEARGAAALKRSLGPKAQEYADLLVRFGFVGVPAVDNHAFVSTLVFGAGTTPKRKFQWLFPDNRHALVIVRPEGSVSGAAMLTLGAQIRAAAKAAKFGDGLSVQVAGTTIVAAALERDLRHELLLLTPIAALVMLLMLGFTLRRTAASLVSVGAAAAGTVVTVGISAVAGLGLTPATVAALPVVLGLTLDYVIQFQARYWAAREAGAAPEPAVAEALRRVVPPLALAGGMAACGFLVLVTADAPLLSRLGLTLAIGVVSGLAAALVLCPALVLCFDRDARGALSAPLARRIGSPRIGVPLIVGLAAAAAIGLAVSGRTPIESDLSRLAPASLPQLHDVQRVQEELHAGDRLSVAVRAPRVTTPAVIDYLAAVQKRVLAIDRRLRPGPSLSDVIVDTSGPGEVTQPRIDGMLKLLPAYFTSGVLNKQRTLAELSFVLPAVSVGDQARIVRQVRGALRGAPPGVTATPAGLTASAAASVDALDQMRPRLLLIAAALIGALLFALWRDVGRVVVVLAPALLACGIVGLLLWLIGLRLSPLAAGLEPLALAIGLEFGLLLEARYREARVAGASPGAARSLAQGSIGGPVMLSAGTAAAGFAALALSDLPLLRQLGWLVAVELLVCLLVALVFVPAGAEALDRRGVARRRAVLMSGSKAVPE
jgi:hydrophobe/amphiphile efflux-3 (HAE3) family protein